MLLQNLGQMINHLVEPHNVIVVQGGNFHCIYSILHRACQKKPCSLWPATTASRRSQESCPRKTHTHTHPPSLALFAHSCRASSGFMRGKDMLYYATVYRFSTVGGWPTSCSLRNGGTRAAALCSRQQQAVIPCRTGWLNSTAGHAMWPRVTLHTRLFTIYHRSSLLLSVFTQFGNIRSQIVRVTAQRLLTDSGKEKKKKRERERDSFPLAHPHPPTPKTGKASLAARLTHETLALGRSHTLEKYLRVKCAQRSTVNPFMF